MARIPSTEGAGEISARIRERRGGKLRPLDGMLLHSPLIADGWNSLLGAVRGGVSLPAEVRELIIMRIAVLNRAEYEWGTHHPDALRSGLGEPQLSALQSRNPMDSNDLTDLQRHVIAYTDAMTTDIQVPDGIFDDLRSHFTDAEVVEVTATVAAYNMVSRFLVALQVELPVKGEVGA